MLMIQTKKIGFTCSTFDLLHAGHVLMLEDAKRQCDYLIVGLQKDPTQEEDLSYRLATGGKPKNAPVMSFAERLILAEGNKYVDEIIAYETEADLYHILATLTYDVRILGSDWEGKEYTGWDLPHTPYFHHRGDHSYSTSSLRQRVYEAEKERLLELAFEGDPHRRVLVGSR